MSQVPVLECAAVIAAVVGILWLFGKVVVWLIGGSDQDSSDEEGGLPLAPKHKRLLRGGGFVVAMGGICALYDVAPWLGYALIGAGVAAMLGGGTRPGPYG